MWFAAFSVRALHHHLAGVQSVKVHKRVFPGRPGGSHPESKWLLRLMGVFDYVIHPSSSQASAENEI